ncbi:hypothetical protein FKN01_29815 [Streptomyces sp. 130]|uniref:hypothetical protein n=1 Tax=Streptomyces sp. 130 TaxID=2591006 RepID=UPI00117EE4DE|nr:hypothetical protein [Streptomyces sp. 130]TRV72585.1 hypothetical protein FKN01_29815 [Streptomyces sp. 130]
MSTDIYEGMTGRELASYDLLDEAMTAHNLTQRNAHEAITALLQDLVADNQDLILDRRPVRTVTAPGVDHNHWLTVSDETADHIREALAAIYEH